MGLKKNPTLEDSGLLCPSSRKFGSARIRTVQQPLFFQRQHGPTDGIFFHSQRPGQSSDCTIFRRHFHKAHQNPDFEFIDLIWHKYLHFFARRHLSRHIPAGGYLLLTYHICRIFSRHGKGSSLTVAAAAKKSDDPPIIPGTSR